MNAQSLVAKVWNFAHVLRDQGVSYQAYIRQISYLLFLKMDEERSDRSASLDAAEGLPLEGHPGPEGRGATRPIRQALDKLSRQGGVIGTIFLKAQNEIQDPAKLQRLVGLIDGETWLGLPRRYQGRDL